MDGPILIVEDDPALRRVLEIVLQSDGYVTVSARTSAEAHALAGPFALAVLDVVLPEVGGIDLYEALAERQPGLPVIFVSSRSRRDPDVAARLPAHAGYFQKPFAPQELVQAVGELVA